MDTLPSIKYPEQSAVIDKTFELGRRIIKRIKERIVISDCTRWPTGLTIYRKVAGDKSGIRYKVSPKPLMPDRINIVENPEKLLLKGGTACIQLIRATGRHNGETAM